MVIDRIGVDLGPSTAAAARVAAAAAIGARVVRLRFALDQRRVVDDAFLADARAAVEAAHAARMRVLAVIDGALTVAPDALADDAGVDALVAAAWIEELAEHAALLARAIGDRVAAWEVMPAPNEGLVGRGPLAPARWAAVLDAVGRALRDAAPNGRIVAGGLVSSADDDAVDYLRAAIDAGRWSVGTPPFDAIGLRLRLLPDGGVDEAAVRAAVAERTGRAWRAAVAALGRHASDVDALWVTGLGWDAETTGDAVQARNLWTAFDTLTADPHVGAVIWAALADDGAANGLFSAVDLDPATARPSWKAFSDFAQYARQISPAPSILFDPNGPAMLGLDDDAADGVLEEDRVVRGDSLADDVADDATDDAADDRADNAADNGPDNAADDAADDQADAAAARVDTPAPPPAIPPHGAIRFRVPTVGELLAASGVPAGDIPRALDAVELRYGSRDWLPPGEYAVDLGAAPAVRAGDPMGAERGGPDGRDPAVAPAREPVSLDMGLGGGIAAARVSAGGLTNQHVLTAFYRAGGGSWALLQRAGLDLADLVSQRDESYRGAAVASMGALSAEERSAVLGELGAGA
ncbi:MAG: hypothetical protein ABI780_03110 [Ardenticatenales bacterium]